MMALSNVVLVFLTALCKVNGQFAAEPSSVAVVAPGAVGLVCEIGELPLADTPRWYRYVGKPLVREELFNKRDNRFFIEGNRNAGEYNLFMNATVAEDNGLYSCSYGAFSTQNATLTVLPASWSPVCRKYPSDKRALAGDGIDILCSSSGSPETSLRWIRNDVGMIASEINRNGTSINIAHFEMIPEDEEVIFTCEASVPGLATPKRCVLGPYPETDSGIDPNTLIPFIIVGVLSVVVILLFVVVLYIIFRHRRCRFCQRKMPEPQMVIDADAIAAGHGFPTVLFDDLEDDEEDDKDAVDTPGSSLSNNQPDLLSSIQVRTSLSEKSPNNTLRENMERGKRAPIPEKKLSEVEKLRPSDIQRIKNKRSPSGSSHVDNNGHTPSSSLTTSEFDVHSSPSPVSMDTNITPRSEFATPAQDQSDHSQQGTSTSNDHNPSVINDLDASVGRKNRFTKKKSHKKTPLNPTTPTTSPISHVSESRPSSSRQQDTIIYAELDFSKNIGMNILGDEQL